jgi:outer membrane protein OmpA-like peptidoglycan-associated protein
VLLAGVLTLGACDNGLVSIGGGGDGAPVNAQIAHRNGAVLQVQSVRTSGERVLVSVRVMNGRDREIDLNAGTDHSYIVTDSGEKLMLVKSPTNADLAVQPGKMMDGALVFAGKLPSSGRATLILNSHDTGDNQYSTYPRFEAALPLDGASGGDIPEVSALSNMQNVPASKFGLAASGGSTFGAGARATSSLQAVEKLKSELGAVETDRGTVVSLAGDVTFDFDKATIRPDAKGTLDRLAALIAAGGEGEIAVEGHTDARGDDAYNKKLSEDRAKAVQAYLVEKGVAAARLRTIGLGELRPAAPNAKSDGTDDEAGRQKNRRVEVILPKQAGAPSPAVSPSPAATAG